MCHRDLSHIYCGVLLMSSDRRCRCGHIRWHHRATGCYRKECNCKKFVERSEETLGRKLSIAVIFAFGLIAAAYTWLILVPQWSSK